MKNKKLLWATLEYISSASTNFSVRIRLFPSVFSRSASSLSAAEGGDFFCSWGQGSGHGSGGRPRIRGETKDQRSGVRREGNS